MEIHDLTHQGGLVGFLLSLFFFLQHGSIVEVVVMQDTGVGVQHNLCNVSLIVMGISIFLYSNYYLSNS